MVPFEIRGCDDQEGDDADDAYDDLRVGDGMPRGAILVLHGHHVAVLACLARSCVHPTAVDPARAIAAALCQRLRNRHGVALSRALARLDIADASYLVELSAISENLRTQAEELGASTLSKVIDSDAAGRLCTDAAAWAGGDAVPPTEVAALAAHVAAGAEVWGGLGDGRSFLAAPILLSGLDPAGEPAFELAVAAVPSRSAEAIPVSIRTRPDPELILELPHPLRLVRQERLMLCIEVVPATAIIDEVTGVLTLQGLPQ